MKQLCHDLFNVVFPAYCPVCGNVLHISGEVICLNCELGLPRTGYTGNDSNPVAQIFWGRAPVTAATSLFRFEKGSAYQSLLHALKYRGMDRVGIYLGTLLGNELKGSVFEKCDLLVPVPLHPKKKRSRGFNQSEVIGKGVSRILGIPLSSSMLIRKTHTASQTRKGKYERTINMEGVFALHPAARDTVSVPGNQMTILLLDDVVTTGSTLEACANELMKLPGTEVMIATVACA